MSLTIDPSHLPMLTDVFNVYARTSVQKTQSYSINCRQGRQKYNMQMAIMPRNLMAV